MTKNIDVSESISDKYSDFNVKRFKIGSLNVERPIKSIDARKLSEDLFKTEAHNFDNIIFETPKEFDSQALKNIVDTRDDSSVKRSFGYAEWVYTYENVISPTFKFNPYQFYKSIEEISGFYDYYYKFSKTLLFVPNIKATEIVYGLGRTGKKKKIDEIQIIKIADYINFVNESYNILNHRNHKPAFVPLSLKFSMGEIEKIAEEYIKSEYSQIWIDFEGATSTDLSKTAKLRLFYRILKKAEVFDNTIIYATNVRREITSNKQRPGNPSSDILTSICGANFIGVNKAPIVTSPPLPPQNPEEEQKILDYKARVLNPDTYYYTKPSLAGYDEMTSKFLSSGEYNKIFNSKIINKELNNQTNHFLNEFDFENYVCNKNMICHYKQGALMKSLFYKKNQSTLDDNFRMP